MQLLDGALPDRARRAPVLDAPDELVSVADVVAFFPSLAAWAWQRDNSPDAVLELELRRVFGMNHGRFGLAPPWGTRAEKFPSRVVPYTDRGSLPSISAPPDGWSGSLPATTARLASAARTGSIRAAAARAVADDPAAQARIAETARADVDTLAAYVDDAIRALAPSSRAWLGKVGEYERSLPPAPVAIPSAAVDRRPIAAYRVTPLGFPIE